MNFNKAIIVGRITRDPEIRTTPNGQNVASIGVATGRVWNNSSGEKQEKTEFHNIVAWGKLAEICGQYLTKGQLVLFEGRMETRSWEGQDGVKRSRTEIIAENMQMGPRPKSQEGFSPTAKKENVASNQNNSKQEESNPNETKKTENDTEEEIKIEDIPF